MRRAPRIAAVAITSLVALTACAPKLPDSVVPGSEAVVAWSGELTSTNAAAQPTAGNVDVAAMTRARFGDVVDGDFVADEGFGTVAITGDDPFTVRYDLKEPSWSDGIPLDAADLLLGWAAASGFFPAEGDAGDAIVEADVPQIDEFARSMDVVYPHRVWNWQSAVTVPVPAHVVGARAFAIDDPMQAKQAVITAIQQADESAIEKMRTVWNDGFVIDDVASAPDDLLLSSGPFRIDRAESDALVIVPNGEYRGPTTPQIARIALTDAGQNPLASAGEGFDVVRAAPVADNVDVVRELERRDFVVDKTHDGTLWSVQLRPSGVFSTVQARTAFLHAVPARELIDGGAGEWVASYAASTSMTTAVESRAYDIVNEDSGFMRRLGSTDAKPELERAAAGIPADTRVCVLYDRESPFATGAFTALRETVAEFGWQITDCSADDYGKALSKRQWNAVITRMPVPQSPAEIAAQWGSKGIASVTGHADADRDELIAQLAQITDVYEYRDQLAKIEANIVRAAVAMPLAANPVLTVTDKSIAGVGARNGDTAPLTSSAATWAPVKGAAD